MKRSLFFLCLFVPCLVTALVHPPSLLNQKSQNDFPAQWFTQRLNHFVNPLFDNTTFRQKYYVNDKYFSSPDGPIILYINGEGPVSGPPSDDFVTILASLHNALIVTLEHRFYGESQPFSDLSVDHLQYLSSRQAIFDLAEFRQFIQGKMTDLKKIKGLDTTSDNSWISIGGSYSGALSTWFRIKFPHLTKGSIASSGVVNAILEFTDFDKQIATSVGPECTHALQQTTAAIESAMAVDPSGTIQKFDSAKLLDVGDFWYMMADAMALPVQYGHQDDLCNVIVPAASSGKDLVDTFANFVRTWFYKFDVTAPMDYTSVLQGNASCISASRSWWWQKCSELAYFQIAYEGSIRSKYVSLDWHYEHCKGIFGVDVKPLCDETNDYYGATNVGTSNVFFHQGSQDPWQWAGVRATIGPSLPAYISECTSCGHCVDLHKPLSTDAPSLVEGRNMEKEYVKQWLSE